jgi:LemA protein
MNRGLLVGCGVLALIAVVLGLVAFSSYNSLVRLDEQANTTWSQVQNAYQRRADLIPNLVRTVQGAANFERETLKQVIEARAKATSIQLTPEMLNDPQAVARFQQVQDQLSGALSRLLVTVEQYPQLKANQNFLQLQDELAGTENRISVERMRYNEAVKEYNVMRRRFPTVLFASLLGFPEKQYFKATEGAEKPPEVKFQ